MDSTTVIAAGESAEIASPRSYGALSVHIDNLSSLWYYIDGTNTFIPPYTTGFVSHIRGSGTVSLRPSVPNGVTQQTAIAGESIYATVSTELLLENNGYTYRSLPVAALNFTSGEVKSALFTGAYTTARTVLFGGVTYTVRGTTFHALRANTAFIYIGRSLSAPGQAGMVLEPGDTYVIAANGLYVQATDDIQIVQIGYLC